MTEKNYNPEQKEMEAMQKQQLAEQSQKIEAAPVKKEEKKTEEKKEDKETKKKPIQKKEIVRKEHAIVNGISLPISTKTSAAICRFIKGKSIEKALADLQQVVEFKRVIPMRGEIPHKKGKGVMAGRYPIKAISYFMKMLRTLAANAAVNGIEEGIISEAVPNRASLPYGRLGAIRRKRTHVMIKVVEKGKLKSKTGRKH